MHDITVVIPVYNVENYLKKCVESVERQTFTDFEIILVDDGSSDSSGALCDELAALHGNIRVIHQENKGLGGARNTGIDNCNTEFIMFLDSDDYVHPELLQKCIEAMKKNDCDIVIFDLVSVNETGEKGIVYSAPLLPNEIFSADEAVAVCRNPSACDKVYKTDLFKKHNIRFPEKVWYEDLRTTPKILMQAKKVMRIDCEPLYYYFQRSDSIMHTPDYDRVVRERKVAAEDLSRYFNEYGFNEMHSDILDFIVIYHAFLLPCLEMYRKVGNYGKYLNELSDYLKEKVPKPLENRYLTLLRKNELTVLKLAIKKRYFVIECLTLFNRIIKHCK